MDIKTPKRGQPRASQRTGHEPAAGPDAETDKERNDEFVFFLSVKVLIPTFPLLNVSLFYFSPAGKPKAFHHLF